MSVPLRQLIHPWLIYWAAFALLGIDRMAKAYAWSGIEAHPCQWFSFELFRNKGIAFNVPVPDTMFWILAAAIFTGLTILYVRSARKRPLFSAVLFLVILGAASNLLDRLLFGVIVDYLIFFGLSAINLADIMIVAGVLALVMMQPKNLR